MLGRLSMGRGAAFRIEVEVRGLPEVRSALRQYGERGDRALRGALVRKGEQILGDAKLEVPFDDGHLSGSAHISKGDEAGEFVVRPGFGGVAAAYALRQHEELTWRHSPGKKAKYLEDPARRHFAQLDAWLARSIRADLAR